MNGIVFYGTSMGIRLGSFDAFAKYMYLNMYIWNGPSL